MTHKSTRHVMEIGLAGANKRRKTRNKPTEKENSKQTNRDGKLEINPWWQDKAAKAR